jgi:hypothetical protein
VFYLYSYFTTLGFSVTLTLLLYLASLFLSIRTAVLILMDTTVSAYGCGANQRHQLVGFSA